jgi:hypothetical protein
MAEYGESLDEQVSGVCDFGERWVRSVLEPEVVKYEWTAGRFDLYKWADQPSVRTPMPTPVVWALNLFQRMLFVHGAKMASCAPRHRISHLITPCRCVRT